MKNKKLDGNGQEKLICIHVSYLIVLNEDAMIYHSLFAQNGPSGPASGFLGEQ